jgi:putative ABC transport system permease protein
MNKRLLIRGSVRMFTRYKLRSFFMALGIVIGVATLVVTRSLGASAEHEMRERMERMFNAATIMIGNSPGGMRPRMHQLGKLTVEDLDAIDAELEEVVDHDPMVVAGDREVRFRDVDRTLKIFGHSERAQNVWGRGVTAGEFFSASDVRGSARVALLGTKTAEALFGDEDPVGQEILVAGAPFRVLGVLEPQGMDPHGWDRDDEVHVPITTLMRRMLDLDTIGSGRLTVRSAAEVEATADRVVEILRARHGLADDQPDDFSIFTPTVVQRAVNRANRVLTLYLPAAAGIALVIDTLVIANVMLLGVRERVAEIGLRKAVGATDRQIGAQFLLESLAVSGIAGATGVGLAAGLLAIVASTMHPGTRITPDSILLGVTSALVVGALAGLLPARQAARQQPVDALR